MDENGIKAMALTRIRREARGRALPIVTSEFSLNGTGIRADLALLDRGTFYGVEIKSGSDTLKRLPSQMEGYARYFDQVELIVDPKHTNGLRDIDLRGARVWQSASSNDWQLHLPGNLRRISGQWLLHLLTADDERRASRAIARLAVGLSPIEVDRLRRDEFERAFRKRYGETSARFWEAVRGRSIRVDDLKLLSRYHAEREQRKQIEQEREKRWETWVAAMQAV